MLVGHYRGASQCFSFCLFAASEKVVLRCPKCSSYHVMQLEAGAEHSHAPLASSLPLDNALGGMPPDPFVFQFSLWSSFHACVRIAFWVCLQCLKCSGQFREGQAHTIIPSTGMGHCVHCILRLFAVPGMQWSVQRGSSSHHHPQHRHGSLCALHSAFVCSARNAVVSSEGVKLTPSSPAQAWVTVCFAIHVCLQCLKSSGQFRGGQAHTIIPSEGAGHCVHCILRLFAVPGMQWSVQRGSSSHHHPQHRHWSLCALHSAFVCSAWNAVVSSARHKLTSSSPARALVTVCFAICVCLQCRKCSGQFREGQAHTMIPSTGIGHCVHCILRLFAVPEVQQSVQQGASSHGHPRGGHSSHRQQQGLQVHGGYRGWGYQQQSDWLAGWPVD